MSLKDWVSDQLYELVELSDENMVDLLINLSARATSSSSLEGNIRDKLGLSRDTRVNDFANQLYLKIPRREVQGSLPSKKRNTGTQSPSTAQYKWIDSESDTNEPSGVLKVMYTNDEAFTVMIFTGYNHRYFMLQLTRGGGGGGWLLQTVPLTLPTYPKLLESSLIESLRLYPSRNFRIFC